MADIFDQSTRSRNMAKIKSRDTKIEVQSRKWLYSRNIRYRKNSRSIVGTPDISIKKLKIAIFINGCFWHGHSCKGNKIPKTNAAFWRQKIQRNVERDSRVIETLTDLGWTVIIIWECELKKKNFENKMEEVLSIISRERDKRKRENKIGENISV